MHHNLFNRFFNRTHRSIFLAESQEKPNQRKNLSTRNNDSSEKSLDKPEEGAIASENGLKPKKESISEEGIIDLAQEPLMRGKWKGLDPVVFLRDETVIDGIKTFYGIKDESFPLYGHLVTRNSDTSSKGNVKRIYYVSRSVKNVLELNFAVGKQLKIASVGLKMFVSTTYSSFLSIQIPNTGFVIFLTDQKNAGETISKRM